MKCVMWPRFVMRCAVAEVCREVCRVAEVCRGAEVCRELCRAAP